MGDCYRPIPTGAYQRAVVKPKILVLINHYLPGNQSGGPVRTIANIVDHLSSEFEFSIVTADRDLGSVTPYRGIMVNSWNKVGAADVYYLSNRTLLFSTLRRILDTRNFDVIYLNSLFNFRFSILPLLLARLGHRPERILIAPRGELSTGALKLKAHKKAIFLWIANKLGLYRHVEWQASSELERLDIHRTFNAPSKIHVAIDLPPALHGTPATPDTVATSDKQLKIVFLSRISPMKNLHYALEILMQVTQPAIFSIFGPIGDRDYWNKCQQLIKSLPRHIQVNYQGVARHQDVPTIMSEHDLFFLPTLGENYGHAIAEALTAGTPVLIANTTPWQNLKSDNLGWDLPLQERASYVDAIHTVAKLSPNERMVWRRTVRSGAIKRLGLKDAVKANQEMFWTILGAKSD